MVLNPSKKLVDAFNEQIGKEFSAAMQYTAIANYFSAETLPELAAFFYRQADEEREHAMKFVNFLLDVGGEVEIPSLPAPQNRFSSAEEAVKLSLAAEETVTEQIYKLVDLARDEKHYAAQRLLDWFVIEQQEEEATMGSLLQVVRRAGESGLLHVEDYLARKGGFTGAAEHGA